VLIGCQLSIVQDVDPALIKMSIKAIDQDASIDTRRWVPLVNMIPNQSKIIEIKEVNCTSVSKMSATTSKPAARIVSPVSTRSTEAK